MTSNSPVVEEVRARAMNISARYGHDLRRYAKHLAQLEAEHPSRVVEQHRIEPANASSVVNLPPEDFSDWKR
jgi:hypothetical protein